MPTGAEDAGIFLHLVHVLVEGTHRLVGRNALFSTQNQRQLAVYRCDVLTVADQFDQGAAGALYGLGNVGVGSLTVTADKGGVLHILFGQVAVRITGDRQWQVRTHDLPDGGHQMVLAGTDLFHIAGTVQVQVDTVQIPQVVAHGIQDGLFNIIKAGLFHHAAAGSVCTDHGHQFNVWVIEYVAHLHMAQGVTSVGKGHVGQVALHVYMLIGFQLKFCNKDLHKAVLLFYQMSSTGNMGRMMRLKGRRRVSCKVAPSVRDITHSAPCWVGSGKA